MIKKIIMMLLGITLVVQVILMINNSRDTGGYTLSLKNPYVYEGDEIEKQLLVNSDSIVILESDVTNKRYIGFVQTNGVISDWNQSLIEIDNIYEELYTYIEEVDVEGEQMVFKYYYLKNNLTDEYIRIDRNETALLKLKVVDSTEGRILEKTTYVNSGNKICNSNNAINFCATLPNNSSLYVIDAAL